MFGPFQLGKTYPMPNALDECRCVFDFKRFEAAPKSSMPWGICDVYNVGALVMLIRKYHIMTQFQFKHILEV